MTQAISNKRLFEEMRALREDVDYIKKHMVDVDAILTPKEDLLLKESMEEYRSGKAKSLKDVKKELRC